MALLERSRGAIIHWLRHVAEGKYRGRRSSQRHRKTLFTILPPRTTQKSGEKNLGKGAAPIRVADGFPIQTDFVKEALSRRKTRTRKRMSAVAGESALRRRQFDHVEFQARFPPPLSPLSWQQHAILSRENEPSRPKNLAPTSIGASDTLFG